MLGGGGSSGKVGKDGVGVGRGGEGGDGAGVGILEKGECGELVQDSY